VAVASAFAAAGEPPETGRGAALLRSRLRALRDDGMQAETADEVLGLLDRGRLRRAGGLSDVVGRASETAVRAGVDRIIAMPAPLCDLLPGRGLRRGSAVAIRGSTSLLFAMLAATTQAGGWCAVVGMPELGLVAAAELGVVLERLALIPDPGPDWPSVVAALLDGIDVAASAAPVVLTRRLTARARQRGAVLVGVGGWPAAELTIEADHGVWYGLGRGRGSVALPCPGRGDSGPWGGRTARRAQMWLPALTGPLPMITGHRAVGEPAQAPETAAIATTA